MADVMGRAEAFYSSFSISEARFKERREYLAANEIQYRMKHIPSYTRFSEALRVMRCESLQGLEVLLKRQERRALGGGELRHLVELLYEETIKREQILKELT